MRKSTLKKIKSSGIKIARVNSIRSPNLSIYFNFIYVAGVRFDGGRFSVQSPFTEKSIIVIIKISILNRICLTNVFNLNTVFYFIYFYLHFSFYRDRLFNLPLN